MLLYTAYLGTCAIENTAFHREVTYLQHIGGSALRTQQKNPRCSLPSLELALAVSKERGLILVVPHLRNISHSRVSGSPKPQGYFARELWEWENSRHSWFVECWGGGIRSGKAIMPRSRGYGRTRNSKHDFWHSVCSSDHWTLETGAGTLWQAIRAPIQITGFCQCQRKKELMRLPALGILLCGTLLQCYARNAFNDGALPFATCVTLSLGEQR